MDTTGAAMEYNLRLNRRGEVNGKPATGYGPRVGICCVEARLYASTRFPSSWAVRLSCRQSP
ncbi:hypothetical protein FHS79_000039 [Polymorphobacter multimanifer]|uniref:Uncharacterized protein n=1 Tax=Polymorphobacter multimanifer TaxID=1070431 RepID=A0A841LA34_9SPHN|nr:hypothetical protein [Polymorphobacter multimanifer]